MYPHPVFVTQTRSCPLEPPPPPEIIPQWKKFRPRKKKVTPSDEPVGEFISFHGIIVFSLLNKELILQRLIIYSEKNI